MAYLADTYQVCTCLLVRSLGQAGTLSHLASPHRSRVCCATCLGSYKLILEGALDFARAIGHFTKDIVRRLLHPSVTKRLGCLRNGSADVRMHRWFADLNCQQLLRMKLSTPYIPKVRRGDLRHHSTHHHPLNAAPHARALTGARPNGHVQLSTLR